MFKFLIYFLNNLIKNLGKIKKTLLSNKSQTYDLWQIINFFKTDI